MRHDNPAGGLSRILAIPVGALDQPAQPRAARVERQGFDQVFATQLCGYEPRHSVFFMECAV
jgi:hypothetical protein